MMSKGGLKAGTTRSSLGVEPGRTKPDSVARDLDDASRRQMSLHEMVIFLFETEIARGASWSPPPPLDHIVSTTLNASRSLII